MISYLTWGFHDVIEHVIAYIIKERAFPLESIYRQKDRDGFKLFHFQTKIYQNKSFPSEKNGNYDKYYDRNSLAMQGKWGKGFGCPDFDLTCQGQAGKR